MPRVPKRITDDEIKVRQLSPYQFTRVAGEPQEQWDVHRSIGP